MSLWRQELASPFPALLLKVVHTILSQANPLRRTTEESHWDQILHDLSKQVGPQQPNVCVDFVTSATNQHAGQMH